MNGHTILLPQVFNFEPYPHLNDTVSSGTLTVWLDDENGDCPVRKLLVIDGRLDMVGWSQLPS